MTAVTSKTPEQTRRRPFSKIGSAEAPESPTGSRDSTPKKILTSPSKQKRRTPSNHGRLYSLQTVFLSSLLIVSMVLFKLQHFHVQQGLPRTDPQLVREELKATSRRSATATELPPNSTLALLYPPGLLGGYRNQVLRFISFVVYAKQNNLLQLHLPSLLWSTQVGGIGYGVTWYPIPMDWIFDVEHWNSYTEHLPTLVRRFDDETDPSDCWSTPPADADATYFDQLLNVTVQNRTLQPLQIASLQQGVLAPIANVSQSVMAGILKVNPRQETFLPQVQHCRNPVVYGGGTKAGHLWNDYVNFHKNGRRVPFQTDEWIYRALQPASRWRAVGEECVQRHTASAEGGGGGRYVALHARVELEIMGHVCGREMVKNLTQIVQQVRGLLLTEEQGDLAVDGLFIAVSRAGMETNHSLYTQFQDYARDNIGTLDRLTGTETNSGKGLALSEDRSIPVFECGERILQGYYRRHPDVPDHGSLLQSVINFHIAVQADIFVGVKSSSYSTEVMTTRYYLGKGDHNYRYTLNGIEKVGNGGLPEPHSNCKRKKKRKKPST